MHVREIREKMRKMKEKEDINDKKGIRETIHNFCSLQLFVGFGFASILEKGRELQE